MSTRFDRKGLCYFVLLKQVQGERSIGFWNGNFNGGAKQSGSRKYCFVFPVDCGFAG